MNRLILFAIGILLTLVMICSFPAAPGAANPIVIEEVHYEDVSLEVTRGGQSYEKPLSLKIECISEEGSKGSSSFSCQSYPCKFTIPSGCPVLTGARYAISTGTSRYTASMVCGPEVEGPLITVNESVLRQEVVRPCTVTLDLSSRSGSLFVVALVLALLVEIPIVWVMARFAFRLRGLKVWKVVVAGLVATGLTLPILWFVVPGLLVTWPTIVAGELLVVIVEGLIYTGVLRVALPQAMALSLIANAASFAAGLLIL